MVRAHAALRNTVEGLVAHWSRQGLPGREALIREAGQLEKFRGSLWQQAPSMLLSTVDDGIGQGIDVIGRFAEAVGVKVFSIGLVQAPERIISEAHRLNADLAGLTVLQLDSEPILAAIISLGLPPKTVLVAGGPAFRIDPDLAARTGVSFVARDVGAFLSFLLHFSPGK